MILSFILSMISLAVIGSIVLRVLPKALLGMSLAFGITGLCMLWFSQSDTMQWKGVRWIGGAVVLMATREALLYARGARSRFARALDDRPLFVRKPAATVVVEHEPVEGGDGARQLERVREVRPVS